MIQPCKQNTVVTTETVQSLPTHWMFCKKYSILSYQLKCYDTDWFNVCSISSIINSGINMISILHFTKKYFTEILMNCINLTLKFGKNFIFIDFIVKTFKKYL